MRKTALTEERVINIFNKIKQKASKQIERGCLEKGIRYVETAAKWGYSYNFKYTDDDLEQLLQKISHTIKGKLKDEFQVKNKGERIVFVCNRTIDCGELTRQYSKALSIMGIPVLIITLNRIIKMDGIKIGSTEPPSYLRDNPSVTIKIIEESKHLIDTAQEVAGMIRNFKPTKILAHVWPWDVQLIVAIMAAKQCPCYNINFNDHAFWIGISMLDYLIEFRSYGASVSVQKRGLKLDQLIHLPYYPIISDNIPFQGFPFDRTEKVVIFTGGTEYKMLGEDNLYFDIMDTVLGDNANAVVLLASTSFVGIEERISKMKNRERVYVSKYRKDISELFKHCDIYYSTYPLCGGMMSQYAATFAKPILAYANKKVGLEEIDGIINYHSEVSIAKNDLSILFSYAKKLCNDCLYRKSEGQKLCNSVIKPHEFDKRLNQILIGNMKLERMKLLDIDYDSVKRFYLNFANNFCGGYVSILLKRFKFYTFFYFPQYSAKFLLRLLDFIVLKLKLL